MAFTCVRQMFWLTGILTFFISPVAANTGGAFSPFGDITTLMVWQKGMVEFWGCFALFSAVGVLSAIIDNIPVMFAVLTMNPDMSTGQWLLVTLTAGVGGSLPSIGANGPGTRPAYLYTFFPTSNGRQ